MTDEYEYGGPYLQTAVFCEKVLQEKDGVLSLIRIVDRLIITASGSDTPERMPPANINIMGLLSFKSGIAKGSYAVKLNVKNPSGQQLKGVTLPMFLEGDDRGANLGFQMTLQATEDGLYWFDVLVGDRIITRMPLRIVYQRMSLGPGSGST